MCLNVKTLIFDYLSEQIKILFKLDLFKDGLGRDFKLQWLLFSFGMC